MVNMRPMERDMRIELAEQLEYGWVEVTFDSEYVTVPTRCPPPILCGPGSLYRIQLSWRQSTLPFEICDEGIRTSLQGSPFEITIPWKALLRIKGLRKDSSWR